MKLFFHKPVLTIFGICLLLFISAGIFFNTIWTDAFPFLLMFILFISCTDLFFERFGLILLCLISALLFVIFGEADIFLLVGEITAITLITLKNKKDSDSTIFAIVAISFVLHLYYIQNTAVDTHQHDLRGILFYIKSITQNGFNFLDFNPWQMYYLFHQPLHFIIAGNLYLADLHFLGSEIAAQESLQYLSLFYVTVSTLIAIAIFKRLNLKGSLLYAASILFSFHPSLFLFSGYISNDVAVFFWTLLFLYNLICWYQDNQLKHIIFAALCFGLGVLSKLSILIITPAVCLLFLYKLYKSSDKSLILKHLCLFIVIAVPLSLIWIIRNHILFDMSLFNIPDTSPAGQNFKYLTFLERIGDFSGLSAPFINAPGIAEGNIWLALIKTELFGEWDLSLLHPIVYIPAFILYLCNILLKLTVLFGGIWLFAHIKKEDFLNVFFVLIYFTIWVYCFKYAMDYPYVCSTDYRLFSALLLPEIIILISSFRGKANLFVSFCLFYAFLSSFIYVFSC